MRYNLLRPVSGERERFIRFVVTGGLAAAANIGSSILLRFVMPYEIAITLAYIAGMTVAFILARLFVFDAHTGPLQGQYIRFAAVNAIAFVQVWLVSVGLAFFVFPWLNVTWHAETIAHVIGVMSPIVSSYFAHKHFSFKAANRPHTQ